MRWMGLVAALVLSDLATAQPSILPTAADVAKRIDGKIAAYAVSRNLADVTTAIAKGVASTFVFLGPCGGKLDGSTGLLLAAYDANPETPQGQATQAFIGIYMLSGALKPTLEMCQAAEQAARVANQYFKSN